VTEYQAVLEEAPAHQEALQSSCGYLYPLNEPSLRRAILWHSFDRFIWKRVTGAKASACLCTLSSHFPQPPDRLMRYGICFKGKTARWKAIEQFGLAAELFQQHGQGIEAFGLL